LMTRTVDSGATKQINYGNSLYPSAEKANALSAAQKNGFRRIT